MSIRRTFIALTLAAVSTFALVVPAGAAGVSVTPVSGEQADTFTIAGTGLPPGLLLDISFKSPAGQIFMATAARGPVTVDESGSFKLQVNPAQDFAGNRAGTWSIRTCTAGTSDCLQTHFTIAAEGT